MDKIFQEFYDSRDDNQLMFERYHLIELLDTLGSDELNTMYYYRYLTFGYRNNYEIYDKLKKTIIEKFLEIKLKNIINYYKSPKYKKKVYLNNC